MMYGALLRRFVKLPDDIVHSFIVLAPFRASLIALFDMSPNCNRLLSLKFGALNACNWVQNPCNWLCFVSTFCS